MIDRLVTWHGKGGAPAKDGEVCAGGWSMTSGPSAGADLLRGAAHLLRTPLGVVLGMAATLRDYDERFTGEQRAIYLGEIVQAAEEMRDAIDGMSLLARLVSGTLSFDPVRTAIDDLVSETSEALTGVWGSVPPRAPVVDAVTVVVDGQRVRQAVAALARVFGPGAGARLTAAGVTLRIGPVEGRLTGDELSAVLAAPVPVAAGAEAVARPAGWSLLLARLLLEGQGATVAVAGEPPATTLVLSLRPAGS